MNVEASQGCWLRLKEAAARAEVGRSTLHRAATRGEIAYATLDGYRFFASEDIEQWRRERHGDN